MKKLTPNLMVRDVSKTVEFYCNNLGFQLIMAVPDTQDGILTEIHQSRNVVYALIGNGNVEIMLQSEESLKSDLPAMAGISIGASVTLYIEIEDIGKFHAENGPKVEVIKALSTTWYGMNEFYIRDNNGYILCFAEQAKQPDVP
ncbi:MAG: bleomycin resistance family protein [Chlorobiaceae bacterium]|nr:bleomycin resistance family protein [Chlorobiaceae bacterium]